MSWNRTYTVPNRFGLRGMLTATALVAVVVTLIKSIEAELRVVAPVMSFVLLVCLAQMLFGKIPRIASAVAGLIVFPTSALINPVFDGQYRFQAIPLVDIAWLLVCGALAGYLGGALLAGVFLISDQLRGGQRESTYAVPRRFGMGTMLLATTLFAIMFAILQWARSSPAELFFYTAFVATVSLAQMVFERSPRWASTLAGGVYLPIAVLIAQEVPGRSIVRMLVRMEMLEVIFIGLLVGYLGGAIVAGIFLVCDHVARLWTMRHKPIHA